MKPISVKFKSTRKTPKQDPGLSSSKSFLNQVGGISESYFPLAVKSFQKHFFQRSTLGSQLLNSLFLAFQKALNQQTAKRWRIKFIIIKI